MSKQIIAFMAERDFSVTLKIPRRFINFSKSIANDFEVGVSFRYLSTRKTYEVSLGVESPEVRRQTLGALRYLNALPEALAIHEIRETRYCLTQFNLNGIPGRSGFEISPKTLKLEDGLAINSMFDREFGDVFSVASLVDFRNLLLRDTGPFDWNLAGSLTRLMQIMCVSRLLSDEPQFTNRIQKIADTVPCVRHAIQMCGDDFLSRVWQFLDTESPPKSETVPTGVRT
jgi:hypothetical protein